jgi:hypothetical protein
VTVVSADAIASLGVALWAKAARRPVDTLAIVTAAGASLLIIVNAVLLQSRSPFAPFVVNPSQAQAVESRLAPAAPASKLAEAPATRSAAGARPLPSAATRRNDPIAELINTSVDSPPRIMAVQRALSDFGYGQLKPSGVLDEPTAAAIEKFESEHKLPSTGRLSARLLSELAALTGHPID